MQTRVIESPCELVEIEDEWSRLWRLDARSSPFQSPDWLLPWWNSYGSGRLLCPAIYENSELVGLAPLFLHEWNGRRQITFLGNGVSDRLGFIARPGYIQAITSAALRVLSDERDAWDLADLQDIPSEHEMLGCAPPQELQSASRQQYRCFKVPLGQNWTDFCSRLPHGLRRNLERYKRQLAKVGELRFGTASHQDAEEVMDALFALHEQRWEMKEGTRGMLGEAALKQFHMKAARRLRQQGLTRFTYLRAGNTIVAANYVIVDRGCAYGYMAGFLPEVARYNPGSLMLAYTMEQMISEGVQSFDFMRGSEPYKQSWGGVEYSTCRLLLWHANEPSDLL